MPVYESTEKANEVFGDLFKILSEDDHFNERLRETGLSFRIIHTKPDCTIFVSPEQIDIGEANSADAAITLKMSCDTAHALWLGKLMVPTAVATGKLRIRGKVAKVIELVPILQPAFDRYSEIAEASGLPV